jgi:predicted ATPase
MPVRNIKVSNFKSFKNFELTLDDYNLIIGPNNSGKTNFVEAIKFFSDIVNRGLDAAISRQGGIEYLRNQRLPKTTETKIEIVYEIKGRRPISLFLRKQLIVGEKKIDTDSRLIPNNLKYVLGIKGSRNKQRYLITQETLEIEGELSERFKPASDLGKMAIRFERKQQVFDASAKYKDKVEESNWQEIPPNFYGIPRRVLDLTDSIFDSKRISMPFILFDARSLVGKFSVYNIDPRLPKKAVPVIGNNFLEEDGSNLAIILTNILRNKESRRLLSIHLKDLLPFSSDLSDLKILDKTIMFKLVENYGKTKLAMPSSLISDGTINILALIISLYFQNDDLVVIEEPERNIHPALISKMVKLLLESSKKKQIIVTTHSPELLRKSPLSNDILIKRDEDGFSVPFRVSEGEVAKRFLEDEVGVDVLFINELL